MKVKMPQSIKNQQDKKVQRLMIKSKINQINKANLKINYNKRINFVLKQIQIKYKLKIKKKKTTK